MKLDVKLFFAGFSLAALFLLLVLGLLFVNYHAYQAGSAQSAAAIYAEAGEGGFTLHLMGAALHVDGALWRRAEPYLQKLAVFLPAGVRLYALGWGQAWVLCGGPAAPPQPVEKPLPAPEAPARPKNPPPPGYSAAPGTLGASGAA